MFNFNCFEFIPTAEDFGFMLKVSILVQHILMQNLKEQEQYSLTIFADGRGYVKCIEPLKSMTYFEFETIDEVFPKLGITLPSSLVH